jgi:hypothetical protein
MAIEQFGESLLADVRSRRRQEQKRQEKDELKTALTGLGVTIGYKVGNQVLANNMNNFLNNENIFAAKAQYKSALSNQASLYGLQKEVEKSGMSTTDFFADRMRPQFEARAKEVVPFDRVGPAGAYDEMVTAEVRKMAEQQAAAYEKALRAANNLGSQEDFDNMLALNAKDARATNLLDAATRSVGRFFTGRSAQDVEEDALNAITNGRMAQNAEKLNVFMEEYNRTKDLQGSYDFANLVVPEPTEEERYITSTKTEYTELGDNIYKRVTTIKKDRNTGKVDEFEDKPVLAIEFEDPEETKAAAVKSLMSTFNYGTNARDELTTPAFAQFVRDAKSLNINPEQPKTVEEYQQLAELYNARTVDKNNLRDPERADRIAQYQSVLAGEAVKLESFINLISTMDEDPEKRQDAILKIATILNNITQLSEAMVTGTDFSQL